MNFSDIVLIFSKDRALQLDAAMRSFLLHCKDIESAQIRILHTTSDPLHKIQYEQLTEACKTYASIRFINEQDFHTDVIALLARFDYVLFLVDDNIFVKDFSLSTGVQTLKNHPECLGFSLRLGKNTQYCYSLNENQKLPPFEALGNNILKYDWTKAECDFGYPLEVSSSVYRVEEILPFIARLPFKNPNTLEALMDLNKSTFQDDKPSLLCYEQSATFCAPLNIVQAERTNRCANKAEYAADRLAGLFERGHRIDVSAYKDFLPNACHQEIVLKLVELTESTSKKLPLVSVIIPCYDQAQYLPEAVESVGAQNYQNWECVIVNDGSPDNTGEVARELIARYPDKKIILLEKENGGLSDARNFGIKNSNGEYIIPLDADDKIHPEMLQKTVAVLEAHQDIDIVYTHSVHFNYASENRIYACYDFDPKSIPMQNVPPYCSLYRREVWESVGGYNRNMVWGYEDWDFWVGAAEKGFRGKRLPEPLFFYRVKESSMATEATKHDAELKARIIENHPSLYSRAQIEWAEGIVTGEPRVLAMAHTEGVIPGFFEPLLFEPSGSETEQQWASHNGRQLGKTYEDLLQTMLGMPSSVAKKTAKDMLKQANEESLKEGSANFTRNLGDELLINEATNEQVNFLLKERRDEGARDEDIRWWWNLDDIERRMILIFDNMFKQTQFLNLIDELGLNEADAMSILKKKYPIFGPPDDNSHGEGEDRPLPHELIDRVNKYLEKITEKEKLDKDAEKFSSLNAFIRKEMRNAHL